MLAQNNRVEPTDSNAHENSTSVQGRHTSSSVIKSRHSSSELINQVDYSENGVLPHEKKTLKRNLGLFSGISFIVSMIIGSGIFISPKGVLRETQSVGLCLVIWALCGFIALLGALCYAEIGTILPLSGSELNLGIGSVHARTGDVLAFVFNWANTFILQPSTIAILSLTFSTYFLSGVMDSCGSPIELVKILAIFAIVILANVNALSVTAANRLNIIFVILKTIIILVIVMGGLVRIGKGTTNNPFSVALAFYSGLWAYGGWGSLNTVTEEIKNPKRNLWLSIVVAVTLTIIVYVLTNISYFTVMSKDELLNSNAVAVTWGEAVLGPVSRGLPILISVSTLGNVNGLLFFSARYCMVGARYGYLPDVFSCIQKQRLTPLPGILLQTIFAICYCIPSDIDSLITLFSFVSWVFTGLTFFATVCCRFTKPKAHRTIKVPMPLIMVMLLVALYLIIAPVISSPNIGFLVAALILLVGLIFYYLFVFRKMQPTFMKKMNSFLQEFFDLTQAAVNTEV
ncbi:unnamed protein product [Rotaria socialis]|uniref:B(0,+)-type amino acid transporter 1 n=1 Tax=Rotaria socialis TaxID=392032 RepID=A0A819V5B3_9BILA|nr:unnamed protein product [Rotaria socialis]CAF4320424.1 unnamed protein product [Rotaria socialis]CAF4446497.1 unnamed protein product [Rotaria socialis]CAF4672143.1 unnamed protein product [Rotaria socialis]